MNDVAPAAKTLNIKAEAAATTGQPLPEPEALTPDVTQPRTARAGPPQAARARGAGLPLPGPLPDWGGNWGVFLAMKENGLLELLFCKLERIHISPALPFFLI